MQVSVDGSWNLAFRTPVEESLWKDAINEVLEKRGFSSTRRVEQMTLSHLRKKTAGTRYKSSKMAHLGALLENVVSEKHQSTVTNPALVQKSAVDATTQCDRELICGFVSGCV